MGKVKVTQKQADWLEEYTLTQEQIDHYIDIQPFRKRPDSPIVNWSPSKLARALYIGYEVEPQFKVGDWVVLEDGYIGQIEFINKTEGWVNVGYSKETKERGVCLAATYDLIDIKRHATPEEIAKEKERRWWAKYGRDVREFKTNDVVRHDCNSWGGIYTVYSDHYSKDAFGNRLVKVFNNHMHDGRVLSFRANELKVICFAEDRKDA